MQAVASIAEVLTLEKRESLATRINLRLTADSDSEARIAGAKALSYVATEESRIALSTQLQDKDVELVKSIVDALVKHAVPSSIKLIEGAMDHRNPKVRAYAYDSASKLEGEGLIKVVKDLFIRRLKIEEDKALKATLNAFMK
jgi:HEAT repeat protein